MLREDRISCGAISIVAVCALAIPGCATTMVPSQRLHESEWSKVMSGPVHLGGHRFDVQASPACGACEDRQRLQDYAHHAMPYVAGPFMHNRAAPDYATQQATIRPPHSKFHPVPTRPAFETRASYHPPEPIGVYLVPTPDQGLHSAMPDSLPSNVPLDPPIGLPNTLGESDYDGADVFRLSPPSN